MKNLINLINRASKLARKRKEISPSYTIFNLTNIIKQLDVMLPFDFMECSRHFGYTSFLQRKFCSGQSRPNDRNSIIENNLKLRKEYRERSDNCADMSHILALVDDFKSGIFMITKESPEEPTPIIWCSTEDVYWYSINRKFPHLYDEWPSFTAFFEHLVEREEEAFKN